MAIASASLAYFDDEELPGFVVEKLPLPFEELWLGVLKVHVVAAVVSLPSCLLLLSVGVRRRWPRVHRWLGRVTGVVVLLATVPTGLYLSLFAKGGLPSTVGFALSGVIVAVAMVLAVRTARAKDLVAHRRFSLHVVAQLSVAVSSRVMIYGLDLIAMDPDTAYLLSLWVPVLGGVVGVELIAAAVNPFTLVRSAYEKVTRLRLAGRGPELRSSARA